MKTLRTTAAAIAAVALSTTLAQAPALATEGGAEGEHEKITLPESQHDLVGLGLFGLTGLAALAAFANARKQLKGDRDQASGEFRWR